MTTACPTRRPSRPEASKIIYGGTIDLNGSSTAEAALDIRSAAGFAFAVGQLTEDVNLSGDALIEFASGQIATIAAQSELSLDGPQAFVADAANTSSNSALKGLTTIQGALHLRNGASLATSGALTNSGAITVGGIRAGLF